MRVSSWLYVYTYSSKRGARKSCPTSWIMHLRHLGPCSCTPQSHMRMLISVNRSTVGLGCAEGRIGSCYQLLPASLLRRAAMKVTVKEF